MAADLVDAVAGASHGEASSSAPGAAEVAVAQLLTAGSSADGEPSVDGDGESSADGHDAASVHRQFSERLGAHTRSVARALHAHVSAIEAAGNDTSAAAGGCRDVSVEEEGGDKRYAVYCSFNLVNMWNSEKSSISTTPLCFTLSLPIGTIHPNTGVYGVKTSDMAAFTFQVPRTSWVPQRLQPQGFGLPAGHRRILNIASRFDYERTLAQGRGSILLRVLYPQTKRPSPSNVAHPPSNMVSALGLRVEGWRFSSWHRGACISCLTACLSD
jgi:hypothetical protein